MKISKAFEGVASQNAESTAIIGYFTGAEKYFVYEILELLVGDAGDFLGEEMIFQRMEYVGIGTDFHGDVNGGVAAAITKQCPGFIKGLLGDSKEGAECGLGQ